MLTKVAMLSSIIIHFPNGNLCKNYGRPKGKLQSYIFKSICVIVMRYFKLRTYS